MAPTEESSSPAPGSKGRGRFRRVAFATGFALLAAWASGVRVFAFAGDSMIPTVRPGDHFIGLVGLWGLRPPERFDLVIFELPPESKWAGRGIPWMKRLVGLPGERLRLAHGKLFVDGHWIATPFLHTEKLAGMEPDFELRLGPGEYCVLGDNLDGTVEDSRTLGAIPASRLQGFVAFAPR